LGAHSRAYENPAQGMGKFRRRLSGVPKSLGGTLGLGSVGGTPEGVYDGMPFIGTLQARAAFQLAANHWRSTCAPRALHRRASACASVPPDPTPLPAKKRILVIAITSRAQLSVLTISTSTGRMCGAFDEMITQT
jgi:hypothetical protein